jgi:iron(III) transport system substrate-binding protein
VSLRALPLRRSTGRLRGLAVGGVAVLCLGLTACGEPSADAGEAAAPETTCEANAVDYGEVDQEEEAVEVDEDALVVYSGRNEELVAPLLEDFTEATGTELSVRYGSTSSITAQLLAEGADSPADVVLLQDAGALGALADAGCLADLPEDLTGQTFEAYADDDERWVPLTGRARVVVYNPDLIDESELPETTEDLVDERFAGQIGIAPGNASFQAFVTALRVLEGEDAAEEFARSLVDTGAPVFEGNDAILDAVDSGELPMGLINHYYWFEQAAEVGAESVTAQLHYLRDGEAGSLVNVSGSGVVSSSDRSEDAVTLVDFLLSEQAQEYFAGETYEYPMTEAVPTAAELPALDELDAPEIDLDDLASLSETLEMLDRVGLT